MRRRGKVVLGSLLAALVGGAVLFGSIAWFLWQESVAAEADYNSLKARLDADTLNQRAQAAIVKAPGDMVFSHETTAPPYSSHGSSDDNTRARSARRV